MRGGSRQAWEPRVINHERSFRPSRYNIGNSGNNATTALSSWTRTSPISYQIKAYGAARRGGLPNNYQPCLPPSAAERHLLEQPLHLLSVDKDRHRTEVLWKGGGVEWSEKKKWTEGKERAPRINDFCHWQKKRRRRRRRATRAKYFLRFCRRYYWNIVGGGGQKRYGGGGGSALRRIKYRFRARITFLFGWQHQLEFLVGILSGRLCYQTLNTSGPLECYQSHGVGPPLMCASNQLGYSRNLRY